MKQVNNIIATKHEVPMTVDISQYGSVKLALRGITDLSGISKLQSQLCQIPVGKRCGVEVNGVRLIAERTGNTTATLITGFKVGQEGEDIIENAKALHELLFKITLGRRLSAMDIKRDLKCA